MSTPGGGYPDWQRITQWFGTPLAAETGKVINAVAYSLGPFNARNFASIVVCLAPTVQSVTVTIKQQVPSGPGTLLVTNTYVVNAGNVDFRAIVLLAGAVSVTFTGAGAGTTIDYSIVPSNANTNAEVSTLAQLGFQHNDVAVANETAIDFEDANGVTWTLTDDPANSRVKIAAAVTPGIGTDGWSSVAGAFTYDSADGPTGVMNTPSDLTATIGVGDRIKYVESGTTKYGIVTVITAAKITFYGGTDYALTNVAITGFNYSHLKHPLGFNSSPTKWTEILSSTSSPTQAAPTGGTWYNAGSLSLSVPIGVWRLYWKGGLRGITNATGDCQMCPTATLSTANNSESDTELTAGIEHGESPTVAGDGLAAATIGRDKIVTLAAKASYYLNVSWPAGTTTLSSVGWRSDRGGNIIIRAECALL